MLEHAHGSMVIGEKVYKMRKLVFKYIVLLLLVSLSISGCTYDNNDDITYKTISMSSVTLEIPSSYAKGNDSDCYKEFLSESNKDMVWLYYTEDDDYYEEGKEEAWNSLSNIDESKTKIKDIKQSELEIDGVVCHKIEYVEKDYSSILIFIPVDSGVVTVCVYIEDDVVLGHILKSIAIE